MKAIVINSNVENRPLTWGEVPAPICGDGEALIEIFAAGVNRADLLQRAGKYPPPPGASEILGLEVSGTIKQLSSSAVRAAGDKLKVGDRVCALLTGGGYASEVNVPAGLLLKMPNSWTFEQGAAVPEVFYTAYLNLFLEGGLKSGERVLIHAGASGVGTAAIQLAREAGARVAVTVGSEQKAAACKELGAELCVNYKESDFEVAVREWSGGAGVDLVLDLVGGSLEKNLKVLRSQGRVVLLSSTLGSGKSEVSIIRIIRNRLRVIGSVLRSRTLEEKLEIHRQFIRDVWPLLESGQVKPIVDSVYPIQEAEAAHQRMTENKNTGKIILQIRKAP